MAWETDTRKDGRSEGEMDLQETGGRGADRRMGHQVSGLWVKPKPYVCGLVSRKAYIRPIATRSVPASPTSL